MEKMKLVGGCVALMALLLGCSEASAPQAVAKAEGMSFEQQMMAVLPILDQDIVLKVCNTNTRPGDRGSLDFSIEAAKADPKNPGKLIPIDPLSVQQQLAKILPVVDENHALNIRSVKDEASGQAHLVFTIQLNAVGLNGKDS